MLRVGFLVITTAEHIGNLEYENKRLHRINEKLTKELDEYEKVLQKTQQELDIWKYNSQLYFTK